MNHLPLEEKVVVMIGGTTGLGFSAARACRESGAKVVVVGRNSENVSEARRHLGADCAALCADAMDSDTATAAIDLALDKFGRFDGLYHVAGGSGRALGDGPLHEISDVGWAKTLEMNLTSLFYANRAAVQQFLRQQSGGSVLNMSSVLGFSPAPQFFDTHAYAAAKSAVIGLTRSSAAYYAKNNIRFNAVAPALIETPMSLRAAEDDQIMDYVKRKQPLDGGRIGQPDDLDGAVVYFLSDQSHFVTGQVLSIDGGWTVSDAANIRDE